MSGGSRTTASWVTSAAGRLERVEDVVAEVLGAAAERHHREAAPRQGAADQRRIDRLGELLLTVDVGLQRVDAVLGLVQVRP